MTTLLGAMTRSVLTSEREQAEPFRGRAANNLPAASGGLKQCWDRISQKLRSEIGEDLYSSWFARMEPEQLDGGILVASVPTRFLRNWIVSHYADRLRRLCEGEFGPLDSVNIRVRTCGVPSVAQAPRPRIREEDCSGGVSPLVAIMPMKQQPPAQERGSPLDHGLTFETFIVGRSNALAHAAAMRVAEAAPGQPLSFNPLFLHSPAGRGKTHLLNAISWRVRQQTPERRVLYITAERFMYHFIAALKGRDTMAFKDYFQAVDVLLIDDFQFLQGKTMQQEFCHTFNSLVDSKRQVIVAADVPPSQLESIDQRMRSRLAGGLVVDIDAPDLELRREILNARFADARRKDPSIDIPEEVIEFLANRITGAGRELEGALIRVMASQQLTRARLTIELAALAVRDLARTAEVTRVRIDDILQVIGRHYNVSRTDLLSPRRDRSIVRPRQVGMYLAKKLTSRSLPEIGKRFGGRDHSTVLHAVRKIEGMLGKDDGLAREVALLAKLIEQQ
jgi:chromosomal replication initiator protein